MRIDEKSPSKICDSSLTDYVFKIHTVYQLILSSFFELIEVLEAIGEKCVFANLIANQSALSKEAISIRQLIVRSSE